MSTVTGICGRCGAKISDDATGEVCPACLLETGLGLLADEPVTETFDLGHDDGARVPDRRKVAPASMLGDFGDYELLEEIGRGGQGVVYRAHQKSLNRTVALKVIGLGPWTTQAHLKRFRREAEAAASLDHPCIVPIYEVGERDGSCYFSMKFVEGGQLDKVVNREPISIRRGVVLIAKLARTVHYAHEHGILHRDIKPGNILLDPKGEPLLTDFGLAGLVEKESTITRTIDVLGTPSYMAPEQAAGEHTKLNRTTDVYGLGAVLYQLLTGHPPFAGGTSYETIQLLLDTEPRQPRSWNPKIGRELSTICLKCLEKDPKRRYSSALGLAEDLEHWLRHEPICAKPSGFFTHAGKWVRRKPAIAALIASSIVLAGVLGWNVWKSELISDPATKSVAVLPFKNLSPDPDNAYFASGIQEEVLTRLASIAELKVISRTSTQQYQSNPGNLSDIAKQLGVANILEGSVQKVADQVRVTVQLINAQTDSHLWAETYDRKLTDIFTIESEIAKGIVVSLQAKLTGREEQAVAIKPTNNPEAYDAYLRGLACEASSGYSNDIVRKAIGFYERAVQLDPKFALGWARLSRAEALSYFHTGDTTSGGPDAAKRALDIAQKLQPDSPDTRLALGWYQCHVLRDYRAAKATFKEVSELLPGNSEVPDALAAIARSPDDYAAVYDRVLSQVREPVIIHWLGDMFDPALAGYWGSHDRDRQVETLLAIVTEYAAKIDGVKISLLDQAREIAMRRRFPAAVRMYTGDDFDYPTTIRGDGQRHSDALLGIFDVIAPAAAAALKALDRGDAASYETILAPTLTLSRHVFGEPTRFYKTGVVFAAYLNGHQSHFRMVGGMESARSIVHLSEQFRLMDAAGLLRDPDLATMRMRRVLAVAGIE